MEVTLLKDLYGVADDEVYPRTFKAGSIVRGDLARVAIQMGHAQAEKKSPEPAPSSASQPDSASPESKPKRRRGRPPKSSQLATPTD